MEPTAVKNSYARWAPIYDRTFGIATSVGRKKAVGFINDSDAADVLEVGVGTGLALPLYRDDLAVTGIDYSEEMLVKARAKVRELDLHHVEALSQMDARELSFEDASFDVVAAMHIVSVVPEPERVMAEMARVCLSVLERLSAPFENLLGWHSDFQISAVLGQPDLEIAEKSKIPPFGMMTFLVLEKKDWHGG